MGVLKIKHLGSKFQKNLGSKFSTTFILLLIGIIYGLFAFDRIKKVSFWKISSMATTNEIWIILLVCFICIISPQIRIKKQSQNKYNIYIAACLYVIVIIMLIGGLNAVSLPQYLYACLTF